MDKIKPQAEKRRRGRPMGSKDKNGPRRYRRNDIVKNGTGLSVEEQLRQLTRPGRVGVYAEISGLSAATIRKKIEQGKIRVFVKSSVTLVEPGDFLQYWLAGRRAA
jgi:hypothetical protein